MTPVTVTIPGDIAGYLFDQCDTEIEFWQSVLDDPRRDDEHADARQSISDWTDTKRALLSAGVNA